MASVDKDYEFVNVHRLPFVKISNILLFLYFIGNYTTYSLFVGQALIFPSMIAVLSGVMLLLVYSRQSLALLGGGLIGIFGVFLVILVSVTIPSFEDGAYSRRLMSALQLISSIVSGMGFFFAITSIRREKLQLYINIILYSILLIAFWEVYLGGSSAMRMVNAILYSWLRGDFYQAIERDIALWGRVRPLVFAREPSFVAVICLWLIVFGSFLTENTYSLRNCIIFSAKLLISMFLIRSGSILFALPLFLIGLLLPGDRSKFPPFLLIVLFAGVLILIISTTFDIVGVLYRYTETGSFFARLTAPFLVLGAVFSEHPVFGVGVGGWSQLSEPISRVWQSASSGIFGWADPSSMNIQHLIMSSSLIFWMFFGLVGGVAFWFFITKIMIATRRYRFCAFPLLATGVFWMTIGGGAIDARSWMIFYSFAAVAFIKEERFREIAAFHHAQHIERMRHAQSPQ